MISITVKIEDCDEPGSLNRPPIKTSKQTEVEVISGGDKENFLDLCAKVWDQHHGTA